jgi:Ca2+-binding RTX toxin-like protein
MATIDGTAGNDSLTGTDSADTIRGFDGADTIRGFDGADTISAGGGDDIIEGNNGNDHILGGDGSDEIWGGFGAEEIHGGAGDDRIFVNRNRDGSIDRTSDALDRVFGGDGNDTIITPNSSAEEFSFPIYAEGGLGHDTIQGGYGDDTLLGGDGNDVISGRVGNDVIDGGAGDDDLVWGDVTFGGSGRGQLIGGSGNDVLSGRLLMPSMDGGEGDDRLVLGVSNAPGGTTLDGGVGFDTLDMGRGGGAAPDLDLTRDDMPTLAGIERILLSPRGVLTVDRDSVLSASDETDRLIVDGDAGNRVIIEGAYTSAGTETVNGQAYARYQLDGATLLVNTQIGTQPSESNTVVGTAADDTLTGTDHDDTMMGGAGSDSLHGGADDDTLHGGDAGDFVAGDGGDRLDGWTGNDLLNGGAGADTFVFGPNYDHDRVYWFEDGIDKLDLRGFGFADFGDFTQSVTTTPGQEASGASNLTVDFGNGDTLTIVGIGGLTQDDVLLSGVTRVGTAGDDSMTGTAGNDTLIGDAGSDTLSGGAGNDTLHGGNASDFVPGDGGDRLDGGEGNDLLNGGAGADTYVFGPDYGEDEVFWFENGIDKIDLGAFGFADLADMQSAATTTEGTLESGASFVVFDFGGGDELTAIGLHLAGTDSTDFLF